jgi:hypothetical protein
MGQADGALVGFPKGERGKATTRFVKMNSIINLYKQEVQLRVTT